MARFLSDQVQCAWVYYACYLHTNINVYSAIYDLASFFKGDKSADPTGMKILMVEDLWFCMMI